MLAWVLAVILVVFGVFQLLEGDLLWAIVLFVLAAVIGPGGYSIFHRRSAL